MRICFHRKKPKRIGILFIFFAVMFFGISAQMAAAHAETLDAASDSGRVLFLSSYSYGWDTVQFQIEGIREGIGNDIELDYEFMDTKRVDDEESRRLFTEGLAYRMSRVEPYDVIIVGDDAALRFAMEHVEDLFDGIPVIFEGINDYDLAKEAGSSPLVSGVVEILSFEKNIELAKIFYPDAKKVTVILDDTITGEANRKLLYAQQEQYPELEFSEINTSQLSTEELREAIAAVGMDSILLYVVMTEDASGRHYTNKQSVELIAEYAQVPAFCMVDCAIGSGALGGNAVSMKLSGKLAAQMAKEIVEGKDPGEFHVIEDSPNVYYIDEAVMRRFGMDLSMIPANAQIINHTPTFVERYRELVIPGLLLVCVMLLIVLLIGYDSLRKGKHARQLEIEQINLIQANTHDKLTGIRNRAKLEDDMERYMDRGMLRAAFMIDIDDFKSINDNYGHRAGDDALRQVALRLHELEKDELIAYRYAGDEFVLLLRSWNTEDIHVCAGKCMTLFVEPFELGKLQMQIGISMGISFYQSGMDAKTLIGCADQAMYQAKKNGKNGYRIYDSLEMRSDEGEMGS